METQNKKSLVEVHDEQQAPLEIHNKQGTPKEVGNTQKAPKEAHIPKNNQSSISYVHKSEN